MACKCKRNIGTVKQPVKTTETKSSNNTEILKEIIYGM